MKLQRFNLIVYLVLILSLFACTETESPAVSKPEASESRESQITNIKQITITKIPNSKRRLSQDVRF